MQKKAAFAFIDEHRDKMLNLWQQLVNHDSGTSDTVAINALQLVIKKILEGMGAKVRLVEYEEAGSFLIGEIGSDCMAAPVIFSGHIDTVFKQGTATERPFTIKDGKAYGPGVLDMKGGVVAFLYAIKALQAAGYQKRPFKVLLAGDEENGHLYSNAADIFQEEATGAVAAFNCETGFMDDGIVVGRKGVAIFTMESFGIAAHVGNDPENGRSAIKEIAHKLLAVEELTDWAVGTSFNVGVVEGGTVTNATPDYAKIKIDVRFSREKAIAVFTQQLEEITKQIYVEGTTTKLTLGTIFKPMETTAGVEGLFSLVQATARENNLGELFQKKVGGGADSAYTVLAGTPTVCGMGVKGGRNHSKEEYALVESLFERAKLLTAAVLNLDK